MLSGAALFASHAVAQPARPAAPIVIGYLLPDSASASEIEFDRGARLGVAEAERAAELLRRQVRLIEIDRAMPAAAVADRLGTSGARAVIAPALDARAAAALGAWAAAAGRAILASTSSAPIACTMAVFLTRPAPSTRSAALAGASESAPHSPAGQLGSPASHDAGELAVALWHPDLERFGARQLSDRFEARYGSAMTSDAWEGWIAVKAAWESALRANGGDLATALARGAFDGHKGSALRFGIDRVLRQPMVIVRRDPLRPNAPGSLVRETPWPIPASPRTDSSASGEERCAR